jgi:hypothetical protein
MKLSRGGPSMTTTVGRYALNFGLKLRVEVKEEGWVLPAIFQGANQITITSLPQTYLTPNT